MSRRCIENDGVGENYEVCGIFEHDKGSREGMTQIFYIRRVLTRSQRRTVGRGFDHAAVRIANYPSHPHYCHVGEGQG
jgi:hypothetical protein